MDIICSTSQVRNCPLDPAFLSYLSCGHLLVTSYQVFKETLVKWKPCEEEGVLGNAAPGCKNYDSVLQREIASHQEGWLWGISPKSPWPNEETSSSAVFKQRWGGRQLDAHHVVVYHSAHDTLWSQCAGLHGPGDKSGSSSAGAEPGGWPELLVQTMPAAPTSHCHRGQYPVAGTFFSKDFV